MTTPAAELIRRKRDGGVLSHADVADLARGLVDGSMSDGQVAAFAMAVYFRGMTRDECAALTRAMACSGARLDWSQADLGGPVLDTIDPSVGLTEVADVEDEVGDDRPLAIVHARSETDAAMAATTLRAAITVGDGPPLAAPSPVLAPR